MLLASQKTAHFTIVIPADAEPAVQFAAEEFQRYVDRMTQALPAIRLDTEPLPPRAVLVGPTRHTPALLPDAGSALTGEQYLLHACGPHLLVLGGSPRGTLYAVYDLLERFGIRWWTPADTTIPTLSRLEIPALSVRVEPPLIYRATWYRDGMDADFQARQRLNAGTMAPVYLQPRHGGMVRFARDWSGHTYSGLVPTDAYFDRHPEYFSEVEGRRLRHMNQLCPTHPEVAEIAAQTARQWLDATPGCNLVSVTQNDHNNWCTCKTCSAMIDKTGAPSGPALHLANEVARRLEKTHPNALVDTFAYAWTEVAPRGMEAHPNVLVRIAPIGNCFGHTIRTCPANARCRKSVHAWSRIARHLFVWHYVTDFFHYMTPFPNLPSLEDDLHFYLDHKVRGMFLQGNGNSLGGDMAELKTWLFARLLWDPARRAADLRAAFLQGFYGAAAGAVDDYMRLFETTFARTRGAHLFLYRTLWENDAAYLARPILQRARTILQSARHAAKDHDIVQARIDRIEASLNYTDLFYHERPGRRILEKDRIHCPATSRRRQRMQQLFTTAARQGLTHYGEEYGRSTRLTELQRAWLDSPGAHPVLRLGNRQAQACIVPALGGRVVAFGPADNAVNYLGVSSPRTFGYPCAGGYEEYSERAHQSPGFSQVFNIVRKSGRTVRLRATVDTGLVFDRRITLDRALRIRTDLSNPSDAPLQACLRTHLEIQLGVPADQIEAWLLLDGKWTPLDAAGKAPGGSWFDEQVPAGWFFWAPAARRGVWQRWEPGHVGAAFLGGIPGEPRVLALDLAHGRENRSIEPGDRQTMTHAFGWTTEYKVRG
ncbi:MAG: hypothetical protein A2498_14455 [Lentisphaerae bacterium RIFOXYC12_FULL_60_16]|nr:MAG: hypothetical protein A2498_14455 [Lentisphaerae bacterium RIFOXYC12_FULL_60_16]OGV86645.1 MAG: hypothetical protein A2340_02025 [Lentisphaerae bacterium RIFOXYB12_FULL_60_10]